MTEQRPQPCVCTAFQETLAENMVTVVEFQKGQEIRLLYLLPHPSGDTDEARLMVFCPFCAGTVGDGLTIAAETGN